jgi:hypothetical protein
VSDEHVEIDRRFNGPPESGHGGYVAGLLAGIIGGPAEVTLRRPPPLGRPLSLERLDGRSVSLLDGVTLIAEGAPAEIHVELPPPVTLEEATLASQAYLPVRRDAFSTCFGCGTQRAEGDGLRIFPGPVPGRDAVAAPWTPGTTLAAADATVRPEFVWASLDDAGAWAFYLQDPSNWPLLLGRMAASLLAPVRAGRPHVVVGWPLGGEGRKFFSGTALFSADGRPLAFARATWIKTA